MEIIFQLSRGSSNKVKTYLVTYMKHEVMVYFFAKNHFRIEHLPLILMARELGLSPRSSNSPTRWIIKSCDVRIPSLTTTISLKMLTSRTEMWKKKKNHVSMHL